MSHFPEASNQFEDELEDLLASGDFKTALQLVISQPNRSDANTVFALKVGNYLDHSEALSATLQDISPLDRDRICITFLCTIDKPVELLDSIRDIFTQGQHLSQIMQAYIRTTSPT